MNQQITILDIWNAVINNRSRVLMTFILMMVLVVAAFLVWPRKYGSEGRLFVQLGRTGTGMDPTPGGQSISIQDSRETEVLSVAELIKSRAVVSKVVEDIGADQILSGSRNFLSIISLPDLAFGATANEPAEDYDERRKFELACKQIEEDLEVSTEKKTSVISVYCVAKSPLLAQKIVGGILAETQAKHVEVNSVSRSKAFFEDNFDVRQQNLIAAQQELSRFRNQNGFLSISGAVDTQQKILDKLEVELIDAEVMLKQAESRLINMRQQMADIKPTISIPTRGVEKLSTEDSRTELFKLETELKRQENLLSPTHPRLAVLRESVAGLRKQIDVMPDERTESMDQVNPVYEKVKVSLVNAIADEQSARTRLQRLNEKHESAVQRLVELNDLAVDAGQLNRDVDVAERDLELFIQKRAEASVIAELDRTNISDVVVAQNATLPVKHHSPKGSVMVGAGFVMATFSALAIATYLDRKNFGAFLTPEELERELDVPVLVTLPRVSTVRNMLS